jgi:uncharacterized protein YidB (DUF937 family)
MQVHHDRGVSMDLNKLLSSVGGDHVTKMVQSLMGQTGGGLNELVGKLNNSGLQQQLSSWIGKGDNQPISAQQVTNALGADTIATAAQHAGVSTEQAASDLAQALPQLIDKATPEGTLPGMDKAGGMMQNMSQTARTVSGQ